jgi:hypothetical protein
MNFRIGGEASESKPGAKPDAPHSQVEGHGEERPQPDAPGGQRLMDGDGDTNDVTQALPVFASWRLCVSASRRADARR